MSAMLQSLSKKGYRLWMVMLATFLVGVLNASPEADTKRVVVQPKDTGEALVNPGMRRSLLVF